MVKVEQTNKPFASADSAAAALLPSAELPAERDLRGVVPAAHFGGMSAELERVVKSMRAR